VDDRLYLLLYGGDAMSATTRAMIGVTFLGSGWMILLLVPMLFVRRARRFALTLGAALVLQSIVVWAIKKLVMRPRPFTAHVVHPPLAAPTDFSFPSGHAAGSFAVAMFVLAVCMATPTRGRAAIAAIVVALATAIALSRVYLGLHYPGDTAGGALIGGAIGFAAGRWYCSKAQTSSRASLAAKPPFDPN
jgi:undecaprenyl-diphosphatase